MAEEHAAERAGKGVGIIMAGISLRVELERLRDRMRAVGMTHEEIAAEFSRRYRLRPRPAFRHAHGWTLQLAADRINARAADLDIDPQGKATMTVPRLSELENWPNSTRRRPTPQMLALLASVYGTDVHSLLDIADREHLRPEDRLLLDTMKAAGHRPQDPTSDADTPGIPERPFPPARPPRSPYFGLSTLPPQPEDLTTTNVLLYLQRLRTSPVAGAGGPEPDHIAWAALTERADAIAHELRWLTSHVTRIAGRISTAPDHHNPQEGGGCCRARPGVPDHDSGHCADL
ncbi:hypothetical protein ThrDRAFT_01165 [Frankia casuarinae]|uniref:helix-turn-helix domain-containing protein n=1 Tax=Frankia casuarinae (strain DSM 45818 / CECT 9043 / HFP020203 / CcI3) TaxID=106370 RepID=UPI0003CFCDC8|nr:helix-turn-helix transcriptional regulator [Frankia casuarinae]ETA03418.1 hypothetical protein CcI6DRAFT_01134 [Frankia sp. CcI6]EYT93195.1 hypothetical protein ThrDRAFT_01165 [Frankia casuarinae]KDA41025.1 hypothetical protein BMG523Draft_04146 [Frankia sp. BMG5.23]